MTASILSLPPEIMKFIGQLVLDACEDDSSGCIPYWLWQLRTIHAFFNRHFTPLLLGRAELHYDDRTFDTAALPAVTTYRGQPVARRRNGLYTLLRSRPDLAKFVQHLEISVHYKGLNPTDNKAGSAAHWADLRATAGAYGNQPAEQLNLVFARSEGLLSLQVDMNSNWLAKDPAEPLCAVGLPKAAANVNVELEGGATCLLFPYLRAMHEARRPQSVTMLRTLRLKFGACGPIHTAVRRLEEGP